MGTSRTPEELGRKFFKLADALPNASVRAVEAAGMTVKRSVQAALASGGVSGGRLRGVGTKGGRVGVRYDLKTANRANPAVLIRATGQMQLIENDTRPHEITPRARRGKRALSTPYGPVASVQHPGTHGKRPFEKGVLAAMPLVKREMEQAHTKAIRDVFS